MFAIISLWVSGIVVSEWIKYISQIQSLRSNSTLEICVVKKQSESDIVILILLTTLFYMWVHLNR